MSSNDEIEASKEDQLPDCVQSRAIQNPITSTTEEDESEVGYLGTTFISEDWGPNPFDSDSHDDLNAWGDDLKVDCNTSGEHL